MCERGHELSPGPRRRLRSPGPLPEASAAAMAHSPVQAGLPGMQVKGGRGPKWRRVGCVWGLWGVWGVCVGCRVATPPGTRRAVPPARSVPAGSLP